MKSRSQEAWMKFTTTNFFRIVASVASLLIFIQGIKEEGVHVKVDITQDSNEDIIINVKTKARRALPQKVLVGYTHLCDEKTRKSIRQGVNVLIWSFMDIERTGATGNLDFACIRNLISEMDAEGYNDTVHLVSFGGWDGPHLEHSSMAAEEWFDVWKVCVGSIFHGLDFDFEGNDDVASPNNVFPMETLDMMGSICRLAKQNGYLVTLAPPQSYLDIDSSRFSRYVNLTDPDRQWHSDFSYFGANVYAHTLAKYGDYVDLVQVQFYESYARAAKEILYHKLPRDMYLLRYNLHLMGNKESFFVDFDEDPTVGLSSQQVELPLSKLVWGFGNGWIDTPSDKNVYFSPNSIAAAYKKLKDLSVEPRGFMFWCVGQEGTNGIYYAKALNEVLRIP